MPCDPEMLAGVHLFEHLSAADRAGVAAVVDHRPLAAGETLFSTGEPGEALYLVRTGQVELFIKDTAGQKIVLSVADPGDLFGELALLDGGARSATAVALADSELLELSRDHLLPLFQASPDVALRFLGAMAHMTRKADDLLKARVSRNANVEAEANLSRLQRVADWISDFSGRMPFLILNALWFLVWIAVNTLPLGINAFDPYPFGLLTMIVSLEAIFLSCFVLISQNRQAEKDHVRADIEYDVNIKAELEVAHLHEKLDRLQVDMLERLARLEKALAAGSVNRGTG
jgi:CRP/FNR family transcriptional regulator, cyclic AMP receptor protein